MGGGGRKEPFTAPLKPVAGWVGPLTQTEVPERSVLWGKTDPTRNAIQVVIFNSFIISSFLGGWHLLAIYRRPLFQNLFFGYRRKQIYS